MYDLIQTVQVLTPEEAKFVNAELDKKDFIVSSIGFAGSLVFAGRSLNAFL